MQLHAAPCTLCFLWMSRAFAASGSDMGLLWWLLQHSALLSNPPLCTPHVPSSHALHFPFTCFEVRLPGQHREMITLPIHISRWPAHTCTHDKFALLRSLSRSTSLWKLKARQQRLKGPGHSQISGLLPVEGCWPLECPLMHQVFSLCNPIAELLHVNSAH